MLKVALIAVISDMLCRVFRERYYKQLQKTFALLSTVPVV